MPALGALGWLAGALLGGCGWQVGIEAGENLGCRLAAGRVLGGLSGRTPLRLRCEDQELSQGSTNKRVPFGQ